MCCMFLRYTFWQFVLECNIFELTATCMLTLFVDYGIKQNTLPDEEWSWQLIDYSIAIVDINSQFLSKHLNTWRRSCFVYNLFGNFRCSASWCFVCFYSLQFILCVWKSQLLFYFRGLGNNTVGLNCSMEQQEGVTRVNFKYSTVLVIALSSVLFIFVLVLIVLIRKRKIRCGGEWLKNGTKSVFLYSEYIIRSYT